MKILFKNILMNPPYSGTTHLNILNFTLLHYNDSCINLSPIKWLQDPLASYKNKTEIIFSNVKDQLSFLEKISAQTANTFFDAEIPIDLGIYTFTKKGGYIFEKNSIIEKVINTGKYGVPCMLYGQITDFSKPFIVVKTVSGVHMERKNGKPLMNIRRNPKIYGIFENGKFNGKTIKELNDSDVHSTRGDVSNAKCVVMENKELLENFCESLETNFIRYFTAVTTLGQSVMLNYIPFMDDYSHAWTDEMYYNFFNITKEEQDKINTYLNQFN